MSAWDQGWQLGSDLAERAAARKETADVLQRQFLAQQYEQYANNIRLPDQKTDPKGYQGALDLRRKALDAAQEVYSPEHHATLAQHIHGLIFGPNKNQEQAAVPTSSQAPVPLAAPGAPAANTPPPAHPFAHNPVYAKIQEGLDGLGKHLKAFAHPLPPTPPLPALSEFAAVPTAEERKAAEAMDLQRLRNQGHPQTELNRFLDSYAAKIGKPIGYWTPEDFDAADKEFAANRKPPATPSQAARAVYLRAKYGDHPTAEQIEEGTKAYQQILSGLKVGEHQQLVFDDSGNPHIITLTTSSHTDYGASPPKSSQAPVFPSNLGARAPGTKPAGGAVKAKPRSSQAPNFLGFTKGNPLVKADAATYRKANDDVIEATKLASQADQVAQHPNDAVNQKRLAVALERQASGRFTTQALDYIITAGWGNTIEQWASNPSTGALPPDVMRQLIDGAHENLKAAQDALKTAASSLANDLGQRPQATQMPSGSQPKVGDRKKFPNGRTGVWDGQGWVAQ